MISLGGIFMTRDMLIRSEGMKILVDKMGLVEAEKFITLMIRDKFDYTEWQQNLYEDISVEELAKKAMQFREDRGTKSDRH